MYCLITRFNAPCFKNRPHLQKDILNDDWLRARLDMFKRFCYPSVLNQSFKEFTWLIWLHPDSPEWLRDAFDTVSPDNIRVVYAPDWETIEDQLKGPDLLVTTRLDSDDLIHRSFMARVRDHEKAFRESGLTRQVLSFKYGYKYLSMKGPRGTLFEARQEKSPFLTLFADMSVEKDFHVYCARHTRLTTKFPTVQSKELEAWISVEHSHNITGTGVGMRRLADLTSTFKEFGVTI